MNKDKIKLKKFIFSQCDFKNIKSILDLGCGNCEDLKLIQEMFPLKRFKLFGIDRVANQEFKGINYIQKDLNAKLPFGDKTFDLVYSHNLLECISDKECHIQEIHRVLKSKGMVICSHIDWDSQIINLSNKKIARKILESYADYKQEWMDNIDPWMGRKLLSIFNNSEKFLGKIKSYTIINTEFKEENYCYKMVNSFSELVKQKLVSEKQYNIFRKDLYEIIKQNNFFYANTCFIYYGKKI